MKKLKVAAIQMNSGNNKEKNLKQAERLIKQAVNKKAKLIVLPEVFNFRGNLNESSKVAEPVPGYSTKIIARIAKKYKIWTLIGSLMENVGAGRDLPSKPFNTSVLINPKGKIVARYRKMHLFDIKLKGKEILESKRNQPGKIPKIVSIEKAKVGLSICYDLRFPELYRHYSKKGAEILCIPSSFTKPTGQVHWHTLIKARAIENLAYVIAPDQFGTGSGGVKTFGHSLIVDPWGKILAEGSSNKEAVIVAEVDLEYLRKVRKNLPALEHRKL
jgi:predicted amidohydrolase